MSVLRGSLSSTLPRSRRKNASFLAAAAMIACAGTPSLRATDAPPGIDPVFECYRVHMAWGFGMDGAMLDRDGAIHHFSSEKDPRPDFADPAGKNYWPAESLRARFGAAQGTGGVDAAKLAENIALIAKAGEGAITRSDTGVRDAGSSTCHAYVFEPARERYRDVMLGSDDAVADFRLTNSAPEAKRVIEWLKSVGVAN